MKQKNHSLGKVNAVFKIFEAKEAVEVIEVIETSDSILYVQVNEATKVFRTTESLELNNIKAKITLF